jgi:Na+-driven multidrug efflux pump
MLVGSATLGFNVLLSYPLIFGIKQIHLPAMGTDGAAIAGLIARVVECLVMVFLLYRDRSNPVRPTIKHILDLDLNFMRSVMRPILPVIANEALWSLGITAYNAIYGHIGTNAIAAVNIVQSIEQIAFVPFLGIGTATAIMVGNLIGQGDKDKAFVYAGRSLVLQGSGAMLMGIIVYLCADIIFPVYKVSPDVISIARTIIIVISLGFWVRATNHVLIIGVLRSGGDTRFSLFLDGMIIWIIGVPLTAAGAFLFGWPIYVVYALTLSEEVTKFGLGLWRYFSRRWINELTRSVA